MTYANDALDFAVEEYDREDLRPLVLKRIRTALFELHGAALFAGDLVVSSLVAATTSPQSITIPADYRHLSRVLAYDSGGELIDVDFKIASVVNPKDYFNNYIAQSYMERGQEVVVTYNSIAPASFALEYYKYPSFTITDSVPDTDSWIVAKHWEILGHKLAAQVAKLSGNREDVSGHEQRALTILYSLFGDA